MKFLRTNIFLLISLFLSGCASTALFFVNNLARFGDYNIDSNIVYGKHTKQILDVYVPTTIAELDKETIVTVVFFYGGCWGACNDLDKQDYRFVAQAFTSNNIIAVVMDYRQFPEVNFTEIMTDAKNSVTWVHDNITRYGGNPDNIYLMGHSSGAHIASMLLFDKHYLSANVHKNIKAFIGLAGPYDFLPFDEWYQPALFSSLKSSSQSQTINFVTGSEAPSLILYGNNDKRVKRRNIVSLTKVIKDKNGLVESHFYDGIDHAGLIGALSIPLRGSKPVMSDIITFISKTLK